MTKFLTTTGYGIETVEVSYDLEDDMVFDVEVMWQGKEISGLLSEEVIAELEMECYQNQRDLDKQYKIDADYDRGEELAYEMRMAA